jgi:hypothetical protein
MAQVIIRAMTGHWNKSWMQSGAPGKALDRILEWRGQREGALGA